VIMGAAACISTSISLATNALVATPPAIIFRSTARPRSCQAWRDSASQIGHWLPAIVVVAMDSLRSDDEAAGLALAAALEKCGNDGAAALLPQAASVKLAAAAQPACKSLRRLR